MAATVQSYDRLEEEVLHLPREDRSKLANRILENLDDDGFDPGPEWREELQRRISDIDCGKAAMVPAENVWSEVNQRFGTKF